MVLSRFDLIAVLTNHSGLLLYLISWLREDYDLLPTWKIYLDFVNVRISWIFFLHTTCDEHRTVQYLGSYYPYFHRTSVSRRRLLTLLSLLLVVDATLHAISTSDIIISRKMVLVISIIVVFLPLVYLNFKLFKISREMRRRKATSPEKRTTVNLKSISSCLLVVTCLAVLYISTSVYTLFSILSLNVNRLPTQGYLTSGK